MNLAMAINAEGLSVLDVKSQIGKLRPFFDVMRVEILATAAILTRIFVAIKNCFTPNFDFRTEAGAVTKQRQSILERWRGFAGLGFLATRATAKDRIAVIAIKRFLTLRALFSSGRVAFLPAILRAVFRSFSAADWHVIRGLADGARQCSSRSPINPSNDPGTSLRAEPLLFDVGREYGIAMGAFNRIHQCNYTISRLNGVVYNLDEPKYVNVILSRWEAETGREAKLLERIDG